MNEQIKTKVVKLTPELGVRVSRPIADVLLLCLNPKPCLYVAGLWGAIALVSSITTDSSGPVLFFIGLTLVQIGVCVGLTPSWLGRQSYLRQLLAHARMIDESMGNRVVAMGMDGTTYAAPVGAYDSIAVPIAKKKVTS